MEVGIGETGTMGEQVFKGDGALRRFGVVEGGIARTQHAHMLELRSDAGDGIVQCDSAFIDEHQRCDGGDRLSHGGDAEDGVPLHGELVLDVAAACGGEFCVAVAMHQDDGAGELAGVDALLHRCMEFVFSSHSNAVLLIM
jgi:hypothetical protein